MSGGYKKYLCHMIPKLAVRSEVDSIYCLSSPLLNMRSWFDLIPKVKFMNFNSMRFGIGSIDALLKAKLEMISPDVIFVPTERAFSFNKIPVVNMVQNMEPLMGINQGLSLAERLKNWLRAYYAEIAIKKSARLIVPSKFVKDFLVKTLHLSADKIAVVYYGEEVSANINVIRPCNIPQDWSGRFIFTAGSIRPARGLEDILQAMHYLDTMNKNNVYLVIAGEACPNLKTYRKDLERWVEERGLSNRICWLGDLTSEEMAWCYENCELFIMSSRIESFGMVIVEAMSKGCMCLAADNPCLPEIFEEAALYYPPKDIKALVDRIQFVRHWDVESKNEMKARAKKRAAEFSWDICAEQTTLELKRAISDRELL